MVAVCHTKGARAYRYGIAESVRDADIDHGAWSSRRGMMKTH
jgi:hypothetical protein